MISLVIDFQCRNPSQIDRLLHERNEDEAEDAKGNPKPHSPAVLHV